MDCSASLPHCASADVFHHSAVAFWEEDISRLRSTLKTFASRDTADLSAYVDEHPEFVREAVQSITVVDVNAAALQLYEAQSKEQLLGSLDKTLDDDAIEEFRQTILAIASGEREIQRESSARTLGGRQLFIIVNYYVPAEDDPNPNMIVSVIDVSERKRIESELRETEKRLAAIVEFLPDATFAVDKKGIVITWNHAMEEMTGVAAKEMVGKGDYEYALPFYGVRRPILIDLVKEPRADVECLYDTIPQREKDILFGESSVPRLRKGKNTVLWGKASILYDSKGSAVGAIESTRDITERHQEKEALRTSEERLRFLLEASFDGLVIADSGILIDTSPQFFRMLGYEPEEMIGKQNVDFIVAEDRDLVTQKIQQRDEKAYDSKLIRKDGSLMDVEMQARYFLYGGREVRVTAVRDITERKLAEDKLRRSEEKYRTLVENALESIFVVQDGSITFSNSKARAQMGFGGEHGSCPLFSQCVHPEDRPLVMARYERRMREGVTTPWSSEFRIITSSGEVRQVAMTSVLIDWEGRPASLCFLSDITQRNRTQEALQTLQKLESLGTLAGGIAHDFNNQLTGILGNISLVTERLTDDSESWSLLQEAQEACQVARSLANQLLTFSAGGNPVVQVVDLRMLLREETSFALHGTNVKCALDLTEYPLPAKVDSRQFRQVVHNLVINAVQAMPNGGVLTVKGSIEELVEDQVPNLPAGHVVRISIRDEGTGIAHDHLEKIFDPFFSTKADGRGLGLTMCHSILTRHGGHISVESCPGKGTTFTILLPASDESHLPSQSQVTTVEKGAGKILIMDDNPMVAQVLMHMLERLGYEAESVSDGAQVLASYTQARDSGRPFDLVIMDMTIPGGMGGKETIKRLIALDPGVRAVVSSGYSAASDFASYGFCGVLAKPYRLQDLSAAVSKAIGSA